MGYPCARLLLWDPHCILGDALCQPGQNTCVDVRELGERGEKGHT